MKPAKTDRPPRDARLNVRATAHQETLIRQGAQAADKSVTDFILDAATTRAERLLTDRRWFVIDDTKWDEFQTLLDSPPSDTPKLKALLNKPTVFNSVGR